MEQFRNAAMTFYNLDSSQLANLPQTGVNNAKLDVIKGSLSIKEFMPVILSKLKKKEEIWIQNFMKYMNVPQSFYWYFTDIENVDGDWAWDIIKEFLIGIKHSPWTAGTRSPACTR